MDQGEAERVAQWIKDKWKHGSCPVCQTNGWIAGNDIAIVTPLQTATSGLPAGRGAYLVFPIICRNCGYTILVNSNVAGITGANPPVVPPNAVPEG